MFCRKSFKNTERLSVELSLCSWTPTAEGFGWMLRRPDPESATLTHPARWPHGHAHQTRAGSVILSTEPALLPDKLLHPQSPPLRGSPSYGTEGPTLAKSGLQKTISVPDFPPEEVVSLNMTQHVQSSQDKKTHLPRSSSIQIRETLCKISCQFAI